MTMRRAALLLALPLLAACAGEPRRTTPLGADAAARLAAVSLDPAEAGRILNAYRARHGLGPVRLDPALTAMARRQADAMAAANALSHTAGGGFAARVHAAGLESARAAENLGGGYYSVQEAFDGWRQSSGHDANLRMREATRFGIALAKDPQTSYRTWWAIVLAAEPDERRELDAGPLVRLGDSKPVR